jgi:hypothetical protein
LNKQAQTKTDYRSEVGTFRHYLLELFPLGFDYTPGSGNPPTRIHDARRDSCGNWENLEGGRPALDETFVSFLSGIERHRIADAISCLRTGERSRGLILALEWYQNERVNRAMGLTPTKIASTLGIHPKTLPRWRDEAVELIRDVVFRVGRNIAPTE